MKRQILFLILLTLHIFASAQTQLLKDYDFEKGGYSLVGIHSSKIKNYKDPLKDILDYFYTNDTTVLNKFKKEWVFTKSSAAAKCDFQYVVHICKNGISIEHFNINLSCDEITCTKGTFFFDLNKLTSFKGKLKKAYQKIDEFKTVQEAREYKTSISTNKNLVFIVPPEWTEYDGLFSFDGTNADSITIRDISLPNYTAQIKNKYPNENFELEDLGGIFIGVKCQKAFSKKFKLYPFWAEWEEYKPALTTYWTTEIK